MKASAPRGGRTQLARPLAFLLFAGGLLLSSASAVLGGDGDRAVKGFETLQIEGWRVYVSDQLRKSKPQATQAALKLLEAQLQEVARVIPAGPLAQLRKTPLWFTLKPEGSRPSGEYHPDVGWLRRHGRDPAMAKAIQFTNVPIFAREIKRMPMLALHELAHAYHDQVLGFDEAEIKAAYDQAVKSGSYEAVKRPWTKTVEKAYAITNHKEYFAESTEAFFGTNDFYPFNRADLQEHDPRMCELLARLWHVPAKADKTAKPRTQAPEAEPSKGK